MRGRAVDKLEHQVVACDFCVVPRGEPADEVGVRQEPTQTGLAVEATDELARGSEVFGQEFDRNGLPLGDCASSSPTRSDDAMTSAEPALYFRKSRRDGDIAPQR